MVEAPAPLTSEQRARMRRSADLELASRVRMGGFFYPVVSGTVALTSDIGHDYPLYSIITTVVLMGLGVFRYTATNRLITGAPGTLNLVRASSYLIALVWIAFAMFAVVTYGLAFPGLLALICTLGLTAGGHVAMVIDRPHHLTYMGVMGFGMIIAMLASGNIQNVVGLVALNLVYLTFIYQQGQTQHAAFWEGLANLERLEESRVRAEAASNAKSEFLANMSHELRTPISGIMGMTGMMLDDAISETAHDRLHLVNSSAAGLLAVVDDILNLSKIEAGHISVQVEAFQLRRMLTDTVRLLSWPIREHTPPRIEVVVEVDQDVPDALFGDTGKLRQVVTNLVGNAFKFTDEGQVGVYVSRVPDDDEQAKGRVRLRFRVKDTGVGIPIDKQQAIFDSFTQVDGSASRRFGGTGLGLTISASLVELLDGQLNVTSNPGEGSEFCFVVPFPFASKAGTHPMPPADAASALKGRRVVVVDSSLEVRSYLVESMMPWALDVREADSLAAMGDRRPDEVVVVAEHAFADAPEPAVPVVILSTPPGRRSTGSGRVTMPKPVDPGELLEALCFLWTIPMVYEEPSSPRIKVILDDPPPMQMPRDKRVLLVEDNAVNRTVALHLLRKLECIVTAVEDGQQALAALAEGPPFDVVFMDVQMPDMDGFEVTRRVRGGEAGPADVTIVALTAHAMDGDEQRCLDAGMDAYLSKPVNQEKVLKVLSDLAARPPAERPQASSSSST